MYFGPDFCILIQKFLDISKDRKGANKYPSCCHWQRQHRILRRYLYWHKNRQFGRYRGSLPKSDGLIETPAIFRASIYRIAATTVWLRLLFYLILRENKKKQQGNNYPCCLVGMFNLLNQKTKSWFTLQKSQRKCRYFRRDFAFRHVAVSDLFFRNY